MSSFELYTMNFKKKLKIAVIADPLDTQSAGIYVYVNELLKSLYELDEINEYTLIRAQQTTEFPNWKQHLVPINTKIPNHLRIRQLSSIPKFINKTKQDVVVEFSHFGPFNLDKDIKRVTVIHDLTALKLPKYHTFASAMVQKLIMRRVLKQAHLVITNSENTKKDILEYEPSIATNLTVISPGVSNEIGTTTNLTHLNELGITAPFFLHVGTIEPRKNLELLISAFEKVADIDEKAMLILVGKKGWKSQYIVELIDKSPHKKRIKLTGYVSTPALAALYTNCTSMIYPSHYEGFGIPIIEALNCGALVLLSDNSSLREVAGGAGLYFNTIDELKVLMKQTLQQDLKTTEWKNQAAIQLDKYTWQNAARKFIDQVTSLF